MSLCSVCTQANVQQRVLCWVSDQQRASQVNRVFWHCAWPAAGSRQGGMGKQLKYWLLFSTPRESPLAHLPLPFCRLTWVPRSQRLGLWPKTSSLLVWNPDPFALASLEKLPILGKLGRWQSGSQSSIWWSVQLSDRRSGLRLEMTAGIFQITSISFF